MKYKIYFVISRMIGISEKYLLLVVGMYYVGL